jgi:putative hydrolase of HD superfamily
MVTRPAVPAVSPAPDIQMDSASERIARQFAFLIECDRLKDIFRQTLNTGSLRNENDAEHSWALCLFAMTLAEHSNVPIDLPRVLKMLLIHDVVEIDAGDTFAYDTARMADQHEREARAADRIFGLLPADQAASFRALWDEFEAKETAEARFATTVDRLQPMLLNCLTEGVSWRRNGVTHTQVLARNAPVADGSTTLWSHICGIVEEAVRAGHLPA